MQTRLTPAPERIAVERRKILRFELDDLLTVVCEFLNTTVSRSGLDHCLRRYGVGSLLDLEPAPNRSSHKLFKAYHPGYFPLDVKDFPQMPDETARRVVCSTDQTAPDQI